MTEIHVVEGDHQLASANETVVRLQVGGIGPSTGTIDAVEVTIDVDAAGHMHTTAGRKGSQPNKERPPAPDPAPASQSQGTVVIDRAVGDRHLCVTTEKIIFANNVVHPDTIDGVAYRSLKTIVNGVTTNMERLFTVSSHGKVLTIGLNASGWKGPTAREADETTWRTLIGFSNQMIEPRLVAAMVGRLRTGMPVQIGGFTIQCRL